MWPGLHDNNYGFKVYCLNYTIVKLSIKFIIDIIKQVIHSNAL